MFPCRPRRASGDHAPNGPSDAPELVPQASSTGTGGWPRQHRSGGTAWSPARWQIVLQQADCWQARSGNGTADRDDDENAMVAGPVGGVGSDNREFRLTRPSQRSQGSGAKIVSWGPAASPRSRLESGGPGRISGSSGTSRVPTLLDAADGIGGGTAYAKVHESFREVRKRHGRNVTLVSLLACVEIPSGSVLRVQVFVVRRSGGCAKRWTAPPPPWVNQQQPSGPVANPPGQDGPSASDRPSSSRSSRPGPAATSTPCSTSSCSSGTGRTEPDPPASGSPHRTLPPTAE